MRNLHEAALHGQAELIEELVQSEEELNQLNNGHHALWYAVKGNQPIFIQRLVKFAAEKGWKIIEDHYTTGNDFALKLAVHSNNFFCAQALAFPKTSI